MTGTDRPLLERLSDHELTTMLRETIAAKRGCPLWMRQHREQLGHLAAAIRREQRRRANPKIERG
jgi:hypothetical protein